MSDSSSPVNGLDTSIGSSTPTEDLNITTSLEDLQTDEQRRVLDTVAQVRKCGLDSILSLPQLVVCGDQSAGKSSVLEALTGVPFPRNDNLCTRFATEIILRRAPTISLSIKVIPDATRPTGEQDAVKAFSESITDFDELPRVMSLAMSVMGLTSTAETEKKPRAFARDVLSIVIEGPSRPQLTLVDIPGLIATSTRGVTKEDVDLVAEITDHYISQHRTICLAVISATNDYANQKILTKVRDVDPEGNRTLGIITKPDGLPAGSGAETAFLDLARNKDIFFKLGWHVLKNRKYEERDFNLMERNAAEATFFRTSNFKSLPKECVGIDALRRRLSLLLFEHVKQELPKLKQDLEGALFDSREQLSLLGISRSTPAECKAYLSRLSLDYYEISKAAVNGHYEDEYFLRDIDRSFSMSSSSTIRRTRAVVQILNSRFAKLLELKGHKYALDSEASKSPSKVSDRKISIDLTQLQVADPEVLSKEDALDWVREVLVRNRGKELIGNFNPLLVGELLWEQASKWHELGVAHIELVAELCRRFLKTLLRDKCPTDVEVRVWSTQFEDALKARTASAIKELELLTTEVRSHPINYNHYYTDTIYEFREEEHAARLTKCIQDATTTTAIKGYEHDECAVAEVVDVELAVEKYMASEDLNMEDFSCEEALTCLKAIYKVKSKVFIDNMTTQVIERHIVKGLEQIFSPVVVNSLSDVAVEAIASEPVSSKRHREFLEDRILKLQAGHDIFKSVMGSTTG